MLIIGLTGSIAMGKSAAGNYLAGKGIPMFSADEAVHALYRAEAVQLIEAAFPGTVTDGEVDRSLLSRQLRMQPDGFARLEALIHPLVKEKRLQFLEQHRQSGSKMVVLDIPLLFEKHMEDSVDVILLVTASRETQRERAMKRPGMSPDKLEMILAHQMPDEEKRRRADFVVDTSGSFEETHAKLDQFLESVQN